MFFHKSNAGLSGKNPAHIVTFGAFLASLAGFLIIGCSDQNTPMAVDDSRSAPIELGNVPGLDDRGDYYLYQQDIVLLKSEPAHRRYLQMLANHSVPGNGSKSASTSYNDVDFWPNAVVPFYFSGSWTAAQKQVVYDAMAGYSDNSRLCFIERASASYVLKISKFADNDDCIGGSSTMGYVRTPYIDLKESAINHEVVTHELGHTVGMGHEHARSDRDNYITINYNNIKPSYRSYYDKAYNLTFQTGYDIYSIMHYKSTTICNELLYDPTIPVLTTKNGGYIHNTVLSIGDILTVQKLYGSATQALFSVTYRSATADEPVLWNVTRNDFSGEVYKKNIAGYRLKKLDVSVTDGEDRYFAVWEKSTASELCFTAYTRQDAINTYNSKFGNGYRLNLLAAFSRNGIDYYTFTLRKSTAGEVGTFGLTRSAFITECNSQYSKGRRIHQFDTYTASNNTIRYCAFFRNGTIGEKGRFDYSLSRISSAIQTDYSNGYRIHQFSSEMINGQQRFSVIFRKSTAAEQYYLGLKQNGFEYLNSSVMYPAGKRLNTVDFDQN